MRGKTSQGDASFRCSRTKAVNPESTVLPTASISRGPDHSDQEPEAAQPRTREPGKSGRAMQARLPPPLPTADVAAAAAELLRLFRKIPAVPALSPRGARPARIAHARSRLRRASRVRAQDSMLVQEAAVTAGDARHSPYIPPIPKSLLGPSTPATITQPPPLPGVSA